MDLAVELIHATVQLEQPLGDGTRTVGTGFLIAETGPDGAPRTVLVAANHVLAKMPGAEARIGYRISNPDGSWSYSPQTLKIRDVNGAQLWTKHPSRDVAAISIREALGDVSDVTIAGGFFSTNDGAHAFLIDWRWRTFRRITVTGAPVCEHYGAGFLVYADKSSSSAVVGGVSVSLTVARDAISSVISGPGATDVLMDIYGVAPSDLSNAACADGSRWYGIRGVRAFGIRRNGGWTWL